MPARQPLSDLSATSTAPGPLPRPRRGFESLSDAVTCALEHITEAALVQTLQDLLRVPSITGSEAEHAIQHQIAARLRSAGAETDLWQVDLAAICADPRFPGMEAPRTEAWGLVGSWGGTDGPTLVLNGHVDVVPVGEAGGWSAPPWQGVVRRGEVFGRGACDMKGGLAAQLVALEALITARVPLQGRVALQSVVGEEDGGLGTFATLQRGHRGDVAVVCEPTSGDLVTACAGALTFRLVVPGRAVHASARYEGVDAIEKYMLVHRGLRALERRRNASVHPLMAEYEIAYPLSVGRLRAGEWASSVPDLLVAEGRLGVAVGEPVEVARAALEGAVTAICAEDSWLRDHPVQVEWWGGQFASGALGENHPLEAIVAAAHMRANAAPQPARRGAPYGSDLRLLRAAGIPTLHYGPGSVRHAHAPDERVPVAEMLAVARGLVLTAVEVCGLV